MVSMLLRRSGGTYVLRRVAPAALRPLLAKRELRVSLRTKNVGDAKRLMKVEGVKIDRMLSAARAKLAMLTEHPEKLVEPWKRRELARDAEWRRDALRRDEEAVDEELDVLDSFIADTRQALATNDTSAASHLVEAVLAVPGLPALSPDSTCKFAGALLIAHLDSLRIARKRASGDLADELPVQPEEIQGDVLVFRCPGLVPVRASVAEQNRARSQSNVRPLLRVLP